MDNQTRREFLKAIGLSTASMGVPSLLGGRDAGARAAMGARKPNIIPILASST